MLIGRTYLIFVCAMRLGRGEGLRLIWRQEERSLIRNLSVAHGYDGPALQLSPVVGRLPVDRNETFQDSRNQEREMFASGDDGDDDDDTGCKLLSSF